MNNDFYVYAHIRLDTNEVFYVGKGRANRYKRKERNKHWKHIVNKVGYRTEFLETNLSEEESFKLERNWIVKFKKDGKCQANYSIGGEGCSGYKWTDEQKKRHAERLQLRTEAMKQGQLKRVEKIKGRTKLNHVGVRKISQKNSGTGNGRAVWNILTPHGQFDTILEAAIFCNISTAAIHKRLASNSERFKTWKRIRKEKK
jgi:hypothetical protein